MGPSHPETVLCRRTSTYPSNLTLILYNPVRLSNDKSRGRMTSSLQNASKKARRSCSLFPFSSLSLSFFFRLFPQLPCPSLTLHRWRGGIHETRGEPVRYESQARFCRLWRARRSSPSSPPAAFSPGLYRFMRASPPRALLSSSPAAGPRIRGRRKCRR